MDKAKRRAQLAISFKQQNERCYWCNCPMELRVTGQEPREYWSATVDHIIAQSRNGSDKDAGNKVASCHRCNQFKANRSERDWIDRIICGRYDVNWWHKINHRWTRHLELTGSARRAI